MTRKIRCNIKSVGNVYETKSGYKKQDLIVKYYDDVETVLKLELHKNMIGSVDMLNVGSEIEASINLRGFEWVGPDGNSVYLQSIVCWRIMQIENNYPVPLKNKSTIAPIIPVAHDYNFLPEKDVFGPYTQEDHDDLPF